MYPKIDKTSGVIFKADNHIHSVYSRCCGEEYNLDKIVQTLREKSMQYASVSDHIHSSGETAGLREHAVLLQAFRRHEPDFPVFLGAELTISDTGGSVPEIIVEKEFQPVFRIGGCHHIPERKHLSMGTLAAASAALESYSDNELCELFAMHKKMICAAVARRFFDIYAHPFDFFFRCRIYDTRLLDGFADICRILRENDVAFELNNASARRCLETHRDIKPWNSSCINSGQFYLEMLKIAKSGGVMFSPGSDAHLAADIGKLDYIEKAAYDAGITDNDIFYLS